VIELSILGLFVIEISLHIFAYNMMYLRDVWNLIDFIVIILSVLFVLLDMYLPDSGFKNILRIRGIFRMMRIFLLVRKLNTLRVKRDLVKRGLTKMGYDLRSPLEKVIDILKDVMGKLHTDEDKIKKEIAFVLKTIQSGKLYEINLEGQGDQAVLDLVSQFQSQKGNRKGQKRGSAIKYENLAVPSAILEKSIS